MRSAVGCYGENFGPTNSTGHSSRQKTILVLELRGFLLALCLHVVLLYVFVNHAEGVPGTPSSTACVFEELDEQGPTTSLTAYSFTLSLVKTTLFYLITTLQIRTHITIALEGCPNNKKHTKTCPFPPFPQISQKIHPNQYTEHTVSITHTSNTCTHTRTTPNHTFLFGLVGVQNTQVSVDGSADSSTCSTFIVNSKVSKHTTPSLITTHTTNNHTKTITKKNQYGG